MGGVKSNISSWANGIVADYDRVENIVARSILIRATILAPIDTGDLRKDGRVEDNPRGGRTVRFGSPSVPYGRIHELGGKTGRNYATTIIAKHYLRDGGNSVAKENIVKYKDIAGI